MPALSRASVRTFGTCVPEKKTKGGGKAADAGVQDKKTEQVRKRGWRTASVPGFKSRKRASVQVKEQGEKQDNSHYQVVTTTLQTLAAFVVFAWTVTEIVYTALSDFTLLVLLLCQELHALTQPAQYTTHQPIDQSPTIQLTEAKKQTK